MLREGVAWRETLRGIRVAVVGSTEMVTVLRESCRRRTRMKTLLRPSVSRGQAGGEVVTEEEGNEGM